MRQGDVIRTPNGTICLVLNNDRHEERIAQGKSSWGINPYRHCVDGKGNILVTTGEVIGHIHITPVLEDLKVIERREKDGNDKVSRQKETDT